MFTEGNTCFWINENESAKYWLTVFNEIKSCGVKNILIIASDNLKGISESIKAIFPDTHFNHF